MKHLFLTALTLLSWSLASVATAQAQRDVSQYNVPNGMGLKGFDPVAIFPEGGGQPLAGSMQLHLEYGGVTYLFASAANLTLFMHNPAKYEPTYGGWCAYAMSQGTKVDIQPQIYTLHGNRAHYFVSRRAKANFDANVAADEMSADHFWKQFSNEDPRL